MFVLGMACCAALAGGASRAPDLRIVGEPKATIRHVVSPGAGDGWVIGVSLRLNREVGLRRSGNAAANLSIDGAFAEWVSRVGPKRHPCYDAAPITALPYGRRPRPGERITFEFTARGRTIRRTVRLRADGGRPYAFRPKGCAGRKER